MLTAIAIVLALLFIAVGMWMDRDGAGAFPGPQIVITLPGMCGLAIVLVGWGGAFLLRQCGLAGAAEVVGWVLPCLSCAVTTGMILVFFLAYLRER